MTYIELAERDLKKVTKSLEQAQRKPNAPLSELKSLEELVVLRREILEALQSTDVVAVVRCRDCVYFREDESICMRHFSKMYGAGFCSLGEREEQQ